MPLNILDTIAEQATREVHAMFETLAMPQRDHLHVVPDTELQVQLLRSSAAHPASTGPAPRTVDLAAPYEPVAHRNPNAVAWPRAVIRPMPALGDAGEAWAVKVWEAPGVPARKSNGLLQAFSKSSRAEAFAEAQRLVRELRWSKIGRLRSHETKPETTADEPPC